MTLMNISFWGQQIRESLWHGGDGEPQGQWTEWWSQRDRDLWASTLSVESAPVRLEKVGEKTHKEHVISLFIFDAVDFYSLFCLIFWKMSSLVQM